VIRHFDLNLSWVSHAALVYFVCTNAVANSVMLHLHLHLRLGFYNKFKIKYKLYVASGSVPSHTPFPPMTYRFFGGERWIHVLAQVSLLYKWAEEYIIKTIIWRRWRIYY